ncbi:outer membrane beta-barrel protein [Tunicatimonas pelagia]|uniref:outer membrane beta-barrel protein n=1 Tax=Tunicatimonas pelagia TaxID=931531 RepID=UPI0026656082|nr:outer membrane beta-barrel protein [Tunicatimonas pelagia]WKN41256.1 outer membrane beta-barrel protein [Tunicatimonas pelagia]
MLNYKRILGGLALLVLMATTSAQAQETKTTTAPVGAQPDLPGMLLIDFGFNFLDNAPSELDTRTWGSRGFNVYYLYPFPIGKSPLSFHTGLGLGFVNYSFRGVTLSDTDSTRVLELDNTVYPNLQKTQLTTHYLDIPLELRFFAKDNYRGFTAAVGGRVGRLINSFTKIKFEDGGRNLEDKFKRRYNLNPWRYGAYAKVGFRGITLTGQYMFSELFTSGDGPADINNYKIGITVALF